MYDIWGLDEVPEGKKIIRTEFQLRREALVELAINSVHDLFSSHENIWKYCTEKWLKFRTNPGKHHTQRKTYFWWEIIRDGYQGAQGENPLVRCKSIGQQKERYMDQALGALGSLVAIENIDDEGTINVSNLLAKTIPSLIRYQKIREQDRQRFFNIVQNKRAKNKRLKSKNSDAFLERKKQGFPTGI